MDKTQDFIEHYASKYYDPVKAREYYLRTRELKGRRQKLTTDDQKVGWNYASEQIKEARKKDLETAKEEAAKVREHLSTTAKGKSEEIRDKLQKLVEGLYAKQKEAQEKIAEQYKKDRQELTDTATAKRQEIMEEAKAKIDALPPIPKGLSKWYRARKVAERREKIAKIRGEAGAKIDTLNEKTRTDSTALYDKAKVDREAQSTKGEREAATDKAREEVAKLRESLSSSLDKARENYANYRQQIIDKYSLEAESEYEAIRTNV